MKLKDCKKGIYVLAKDKSIGMSFNDFLKYSPLGVGQIVSVWSSRRIGIVPLRSWMNTIVNTIGLGFLPEDLIELKNENIHQSD